jgi:hypothetical protein
MAAGMEAKLRPLLLDAEGVLSRLACLEEMISSRETDAPALAAHIRAARASADCMAWRLAIAVYTLLPLEKEDVHQFVDQRPQAKVAHQSHS